MDAPPLVVAGTITLDTLHLPSGLYTDVAGGSAVYGAMGAAESRSSAVVGTVGTDFPLSALAALVNRGVDVGGIRREPGKTFRWTARYAPDLETRQTLARDLGVGAVIPEVPDRLRVGRSWAFLGSMDPRAQLSVVEQLGEGVRFGLDTMGHWIRDGRPELLKLVKDAETLFVSEDEVQLLGEGSNPEVAARWLVDLGAQCVVVKAGARGAVAYMGDGTGVECPPLSVERVVDPTGAGDAFGGAFIAALSQQRGPVEALACGAAAASFAIEGVSLGGFDRAQEGDFGRRMAQAMERIQSVSWTR